MSKRFNRIPISLPIAGFLVVLSFALILVASSTTPTVHGAGGVEGTFEYAFDAPWRIEPSIGPDGQLEYGAIPIQITIHDANIFNLDNVPEEIPAKFGEFQWIKVTERGFQPTTYMLSDLDEIEMTTGAWPWPKEDSPPEHAIYRGWRGWEGDDPEPFRDISETSEWHALIWYQPREVPTPGFELPLEIELKVSRSSRSGTILRNHLKVYFGDAPLPRFDNKWLYGDLHYHGQGNDNEGESAYNYRGVIRAMGAMGLDFIFATEHASDSEQIIDADLDVDVDVDIEFGWPPVSVNARLLSRCSRGGVLRDMSSQRFAFNHGLI